MYAPEYFASDMIVYASGAAAIAYASSSAESRSHPIFARARIKRSGVATDATP